ncbi:hypothetical protein GLX27_000317 [Malassezia furfur]|uniref:UspA domain-containing protein n=1 Tax=Malassezia furfur TaxID=55194 RepID=A0ABY8EMV6_MALFU|nr:hypothetical protein GLX27_000317 [Malassezia furfur]
MSGSGRISPSRLGPTEYVQAMQARHPQAHVSPEVSRRKRRNRMSLFSRQTKDDDAIWKGYERIVGFDTMPDAEDTVSGSASYTLQVKSHGYSRTKHTRTFMCAVDATESSERALEWIMENLVDDGDEIVAVRVLDSEQDVVTQEKAREGAHSLLSSIVELNENTRKISITVEFLSGPIKSSILRLVTMYRPESLTIGTRGKQVSALEKMLGTTPLGNLSKSLIWQSPVPVIIVRPEDRVKKHLLKRMSDPRRHEYYDLVQHDDDLPMSLPKNKEEK